MRCQARLTYHDPYESYLCALEVGHTYPDGTPSNHECYENDQLVAEWGDGMVGAS
jgi:hypothetical protein